LDRGGSPRLVEEHEEHRDSERAKERGPHDDAAHQRGGDGKLGPGCKVVALTRSLRVVIAVALLLGSFPLVAPGEAQRGWLITPGRSWGPILLGEKEDGVLSVLGPPQKRTDAPFRSDWDYPTANLQFFRHNPDDKFELGTMRISDRASVTREGIKVGAPLNAVVRTYGDTNDNASTNPPRWCLGISINANRPTGASQPDYTAVFLDLAYPDRGIWFSIISPANSGQPPSVYGITIAYPGKCPAPVPSPSPAPVVFTAPGIVLVSRA
jgi:hypothetical protein